MPTLPELLTDAAPRHGVTPDALASVQARAETVFLTHTPAPALLDRWLAYLKDTEPYWFAPLPPVDVVDHTRYAGLPATDRLTYYRASHPPTPKRPALVLTPAQVQSLAGLSPMARLTEARRLAATTVAQ